MEVNVKPLPPDGNEGDCLARPYNTLLCSVIATQQLTIRGLKLNVCHPCLQTVMGEIEGGAVLTRVILDQWRAAVAAHERDKPATAAAGAQPPTNARKRPASMRRDKKH